MDLSSLVPFLTNGTIAVAVIILILAGVLVPGWMYRDLKRENAELKRTVGAERARADASSEKAEVAVDAARTASKAFDSLRRLSGMDTHDLG